MQYGRNNVKASPYKIEKQCTFDVNNQWAWYCCDQEPTEPISLLSVDHALLIPGQAQQLGIETTYAVSFRTRQPSRCHHPLLSVHQN